MSTLSDFKKIVVLTGAGISADSGLATFREQNGLWEKHRIEDVATPKAYERDPELVWRFYSMRRIQAGRAHPNPAHEALVKFGRLTLITQNVDDLHERADKDNRIETYPMHGSLNQSRCTQCEAVYYDDYAYFDLNGNYAPQEAGLCNSIHRASDQYLHHYHLDYRYFLPLSPCCKAPIRPHIVWFGEVPLHMDRILHRLRDCDLFVSIGTSGQVYPAAGFLSVAKTCGARTVVINKDEIPQLPYVDEFIQGSAALTVPKYFGV